MPQRRERPLTKRRGEIGESVKVLSHIGSRTHTIEVYRKIEDEDGIEDLDSVTIVMRPGISAMNLTHLRSDELAAFRRFIIDACDRAAPICAELDRRAEEAIAQGKKGFRRVYRPEPTYITFD